MAQQLISGFQVSSNFMDIKLIQGFAGLAANIAILRGGYWILFFPVKLAIEIVFVPVILAVFHVHLVADGPLIAVRIDNS